MNRITQSIDINQSPQADKKQKPAIFSVFDPQNQSIVLIQDLSQTNVDHNSYHKQKQIKEQVEEAPNEQIRQLKIRINGQTLYKIQQIEVQDEIQQSKNKNKNQNLKTLDKTVKKQKKYNQIQQKTKKKGQQSKEPEVKPYKEHEYENEPIFITHKKQKLNQIPIKPIQQQKPKELPFFINKQEYGNYIKAVFILQQILDPIQKQNLLDYKEQKHVQFLFLITVRIKNSLTSSYKLFKQKLKHDKQNLPLKNLLEEISAYLQKSQIKFKIYNEQLDRIRQKLGKKLSRIFHLDKSVKSKQKFLDGFENLDYTIIQQVQFTHRNYIEIVLNSPQIKSQYFKDFRLKKVLKGYRKICLIQSQSCENELQLKNRINQIIIDQ